MLNGVGGLRIRWNLVAQPDEFIKPPWKKEEERITCRKKGGKWELLSQQQRKG